MFVQLRDPADVPLARTAAGARSAHLGGVRGARLREGMGGGGGGGLYLPGCQDDYGTGAGV